jgi:hypothetical protein
MRHDDWSTRLSQYIDAMREEPFDFARHNCLFFAFGAIKAVNDLDLYPLYAGKAENVKVGKRALKEVDGVDTVEACLQKHLNQEFQPPAFARIGDIVFITNDNALVQLATDIKLFGPIPGICYGANSFFLGEHELIELPTLTADKTLWVS